MGRFRSRQLAIAFLIAATCWGVPIAVHSQEKSIQGQAIHGDPDDNRLANYTLALAIFTSVLAISTIGLWFVTWRTGVKQARDTRTLERAFIFVKEIGLFIDRAPGPMGAFGQPLLGPAIEYRISAILENSGQSPARRAIYNFNCGHIGDENLIAYNFPDQQAPRHCVVGPKATLETYAKTISTASMQEIVRGTNRWFIWGWIDFDDVFDDTARHRTEFCFEVSGRLVPDGQIHVGFPMHSRFNGTDNDCLRKATRYTPPVL